MSTAKVGVPSSPQGFTYLQNGREGRGSVEDSLSSPVSSGYSSSRDSISAEQQFLPDHEIQRTKRRRRDKSDVAVSPKVCAVCGDQAKNTHFGGVCCDSCKAFFRRSVQSNSYSKFHCSANKECPVVKNKRRLCQYCRFQKCQKIGMEISLVMSEAERIAMWKKKLAKRRETSPKGDSTRVSESRTAEKVEEKKQSSQESGNKYLPFTPEPQAGIIRFKGITTEEVNALRHLVTLQQLVFSSIPYPENCFGNTPETLANLFFQICLKIRSLFLRIDDFHDIPKEDQMNILRNGIGMSIYIYGAYNYDSKNQRWPADGINEALKLPSITKETLKIFSIFPELYLALMNFYNNYGCDMKDEAVVVLMCLIALFHDGNEKLIARERINKLNNRYIALLRNYLVSKQGYDEGNALLARLLRSLFDIKNLVSFHNKVDVKPSIQINPSSSNTAAACLQSQLSALTDVMKRQPIGGFPEHSSAFTPEEKVDLELTQRHIELSFRRPQSLPDPRPDICLPNYHHAFTDAVFGSQINTNKILSLSEIFKGNRIFKSSPTESSCPGQADKNIVPFRNNRFEFSFNDSGEKSIWNKVWPVDKQSQLYSGLYSARYANSTMIDS